MTIAKRAAAEGLGTLVLLATIVGSGIMGERLDGGNAAVALLANAVATGAALYALILGLGPISGAHLNPVVTLTEAWARRLPRAHVPAYIGAQVAGAIAGVVIAHAMFGLDLVQQSQHARSTHGELIGELVATFGLLLVISTASRARATSVPAAVALYIVAAYWFTSSTSFANPAVTIARALTDTFSGIRPADVAPFVAAQLAGGMLAAVVVGWLVPAKEPAGGGA
jgi:glycerol uptake facilitator-like aquaporin